jgi:hypothetical protein
MFLEDSPSKLLAIAQAQSPRLATSSRRALASARTSGPQRVDERLREEVLELSLARTGVQPPHLVIQPLNDS